MTTGQLAEIFYSIKRDSLFYCLSKKLSIWPGMNGQREGKNSLRAITFKAVGELGKLVRFAKQQFEHNRSVLYSSHNDASA